MIFLTCVTNEYESNITRPYSLIYVQSISLTAKERKCAEVLHFFVCTDFRFLVDINDKIIHVHSTYRVPQHFFPSHAAFFYIMKLLNGLSHHNGYTCVLQQ